MKGEQPGAKAENEFLNFHMKGPGSDEMSYLMEHEHQGNCGKAYKESGYE